MGSAVANTKQSRQTGNGKQRGCLQGFHATDITVNHAKPLNLLSGRGSIECQHAKYSNFSAQGKVGGKLFRLVRVCRLFRLGGKPCARANLASLRHGRELTHAN